LISRSSELKKEKEGDDSEQNDNTKPERTLAEKLEAFYAKHNPEKVSSAAETAKKFKKTPKKLEAALKKKYGEGLENY